MSDQPRGGPVDAESRAAMAEVRAEAAEIEAKKQISGRQGQIRRLRRRLPDEIQRRAEKKLREMYTVGSPELDGAMRALEVILAVVADDDVFAALEKE